MRLLLQVDLLIIKLNQHMPRISPMGMFQVNLELFPIVIAYSSHIRNMNDVFFFLHLQLTSITITYILVINGHHEPTK